MSPGSNHLLPVLALALLGTAWSPLQAQGYVDPMARWRAQIENARRLTVPPPPKGTKELQWNELSPAGWNPGRILERLGVEDLADNDPHVREIEREIRREWDNAPTVTRGDDAPVRMTGYPIIMAEGEGLAKTIILVPYHGACVHRPAPPANQMVVVSLKQGLPRNIGQTPLWITGRLHTLATPTAYGRVAYTMTDASWQKYPAERYPLPQYIPLR